MSVLDGAWLSGLRGRRCQCQEGDKTSRQVKLPMGRQKGRAEAILYPAYSSHGLDPVSRNGDASNVTLPRRQSWPAGESQDELWGNTPVKDRTCWRQGRRNSHEGERCYQGCVPRGGLSPVISMPLQIERGLKCGGEWDPGCHSPHSPLLRLPHTPAKLGRRGA